MNVDAHLMPGKDDEAAKPASDVGLRKALNGANNVVS